MAGNDEATLLSSQDNHDFQKAIAEANARQSEAATAEKTAEATIERAKADEEKARASVSLAQLKNQEEENEAKRAAERERAQADALKEISNAISALTSRTAVAGNDEATLLLLGNYAKEKEFKTPIIRALEIRLSRPLRTAGEELAAMRLGDDLLPDSFRVLAHAALIHAPSFSRIWPL